MAEMPLRSLFPDTRAWIRALPAGAGRAPAPDGDLADGPLPDHPAELFLRWLESAVLDGVTEPHAATLSTVDAEGHPDARTLLLKDVTADGWWFSGDVRSPKGRQLAAHPAAALTFYWREHGRQVRVRGAVIAGGPAVSTRDYLQRSVLARAIAAVSRQSEPLPDPAEYRRAVDAETRAIEADPERVSATWQAWCLVPESVEFWHADPGRRHLRRRYRTHREPESGRCTWVQEQLWP